MTPAARVAAAIEVLDDILGGRSAEQALSAWARGSRFAGSKDRAALRDLVFDALRCRGSCAALGGGLHGRGLMLGLGVQQGWTLEDIFSGARFAPAPLTGAERTLLLDPPTLAAHDADDLPAWIHALWSTDLGKDATAAAQDLRKRAPLFLRVNMRRGTVARARAALAEEDITAAPHPQVAGCLEVTSNARRVKLSRAYGEGLVEIQDAASQTAVAALDIPTGARVLDYCAGGGGKALAIADQFDATIVAHDVLVARTGDITPRAARAGVTIKVCDTDALHAEAPFDVVVVDAPCSGSGTWRRNPEAKWALSPEDLADFATLQGEVLAQAAAHVAAQGQLIYMTCSVFRAENADVVAQFLAQSPDYVAHDALRLVPGALHDGFCSQMLRKK